MQGVPSECSWLDVLETERGEMVIAGETSMRTGLHHVLPFTRSRWIKGYVDCAIGRLFRPKTRFFHHFARVMNQLSTRIDQLRARVDAACLRSGRRPGDISIVAVSKTQPIDALVTMRNLGIRTFGENYVQELLLKHAHDGLDDVSWHFIGHLQSNKVKYIAPFVRMIHSVDSASLAHEISRQAVKFHRRIDILFQVNTSGESSKSGVAPKDLLPLVRDCISLPSIRLCGLMTIPAPVDDADDVRSEFRLLRELCDSVRTELSLPSFVELSMGMSDDYEVAIEEGATIIRPGTALFGSRQAIS